MKIVQINAVYARLSTGRTTREMHEYFLSHGIESYVAAPDLAGLKDNCFKIGGSLDHKIHALHSRITGKQAYASHVPTKKLINWMDNIHPDIVILRNLHGNFINLPSLSKFLADRNIPTIAVLHDSWLLTGGCTYYITPKCDRWKSKCGKCPVYHHDMTSWFFDRTSEVLEERKHYLGSIPRLSLIGVSQWVANDAKLSVLGSSAYRVQCIYNWIDLKLFHPQEKSVLKIKKGFDKESFIVLGVSTSWVPVKGIKVFHELADILPTNIKIVLIGNSDSIKEKHPNIIYMPRTANLKQLAEMYAMADVFVNPTVQETFGKTTAEALSCGTPVVAYNGTATPELVGLDGSCGYLIDNLDAQEYATKIIEIQQNKHIPYSDNCRRRAESMFDMETNIQQYIRLIKDMISNQSE